MYENYFRHFRLHEGSEPLRPRTAAAARAKRAAFYSYEAYGCEPHGWSSHRRYRAFLLIKWRVLTQREELPF